MNVDEITEEASDLIRVLAEHVGNPPAIRGAMREWFADLGAERLALVAVAAVVQTFSDCLSVVPDLAPGSTSFAAPKETP